MSDDPWAGKPSSAGRCDPKGDVPKLHLLPFVSLARDVAGAVKQVAEPFVDAAKGMAEEGRRERDERMIREALERTQKENIANGSSKYGDHQQGMGAPPADPITMAKAAAAQYDYKYQVAQINGDTAAMADAAAALVTILMGVFQGMDRMRKDKERLEQVREEILRNAPNMAGVVRNVTQNQLTQMRRHPGPGRIPRHHFEPPLPPRRR